MNKMKIKELVEKELIHEQDAAIEALQNNIKSKMLLKKNLSKQIAAIRAQIAQIRARNIGS
jgi:hypothetical protein